MTRSSHGGGEREAGGIPTEAKPRHHASHAAELPEVLAERTERAADRAIERLKADIHLPDVRGEAHRARAFFAGIETATLWGVLALYLVTAAAGTLVALLGVSPLGALHDWFMHGAAYAVVFSFLVLYVKAFMQRRRVARVVLGLATAAQELFYAWVLVDLVPPRAVVLSTGRGPEVLTRPVMPSLYLPAVLLALSAGLLLAHLALARGRAVPPKGGAARA